ncbi:MAG: ComF family protein [Bacteroidales bacterium]
MMWKDFFQLLFPRACLLCYESLVWQEKYLCLHCLHKLPYTHYWEEKDNPAAQLFWGKVPVEWVIPFLHYTKNYRVQKMLLQIKYHNRPDVAEYMGVLFGNILKQTPLQLADAITAVPLHATRLKQRGYNQSEKIAKGIAEAMNLPLWTDIVERKTWQLSQTRKGRYERWENVQDAFELVNPSKVVGKHIILVDDVLTTGSTLEACAASLLTASRVTLSIVTLAKAELI